MQGANPYRTEADYGRKDLESLMGIRAQRFSKIATTCIDFTIAPEWGEAWSNAGEGITARYRLLKDGCLIGLFQGLVRRNFLYSYMTAGSNSASGMKIVTEDFNRDSVFFLRDILAKEEKLSNFAIFADSSLDLPGLTSKEKHTFRIDLTRPLDDLTRSMNKSTRWAIRKARNNHLKVEVSHSTDALRDTYAMVVSLSKTKNFVIPRLRWLQNIHSEFRKYEGLVSVLVSLKGDLISAGCFLGYEGKINWVLGGSTQIGYRTQAGSLIQMELIEWAKKAGFKVYDMGGTVPNDRIYAGIHAFKSGFGGSIVSNFLIQKKTLFGPIVPKLYNIYRRLASR